jgi:hypothetical protein
MRKLRFNECIYGYGFEDIEFDLRAHAAGYGLRESGLIVIHLYHPDSERAIDPVLHARNEAMVAVTRSLLRRGRDPAALPQIEISFAKHKEWSSALCLILSEKRVYVSANDAWGRYSFGRNDHLVIEWDNPNWPCEEFRLEWEPLYKLVSQHPQRVVPGLTNLPGRGTISF